MKVADTEEEISALQAASPREPVCWVRPDKCIEVHVPGEEEPRVYPLPHYRQQTS